MIVPATAGFIDIRMTGQMADGLVKCEACLELEYLIEVALFRHEKLR